MNKMISRILKNNYGIVTNSNPRTFPKGLTCEVVKADILYNVKLKNTFTIECGPNKVLTKLCQSNDIQNVFDSSLESLNNLIQSSYE